MNHLKVGQVAQVAGCGRKVVKDILCDEDWADCADRTEAQFQVWLDTGSVEEIGEFLSGILVELDRELNPVS